MQIGVNYRQTIYMMTICVLLLFMVYNNHSRNTHRYRLLKDGLILMTVNQVMELIRIGIVAGTMRVPSPVVFVIYALYYMSEIIVVLIIAEYVLDYFPHSEERVHLRQTVYFVVSIAVAIMVLSTPYTGLIYEIDSNGTIMPGSAYTLIFFGRLFMLIWMMMLTYKRRGMLSLRVYENWMVMLGVLTVITVFQIFIRDLNVFGLACTVFFGGVYCMFHCNRYETDHTYMNKDMYQNELIFRDAKKQPCSVCEIKISNYDNLLERNEYSMDQIYDIHKELKGRLIAYDRCAMLYRTSPSTYGVIAVHDSDREQTEKMAQQLCDWMGELLDGKLICTVVGRTSDVVLRSLKDEERLFYNLHEKCMPDGWYLCEQEDVDALYSRDEILDVLDHIVLQEQDIVLFAKPVVGGMSLRVEYFEVLSRVQLAGGGIIHPDEFLHLAQQYGYIHEVTLAVLRRLCEQILEQGMDCEDMHFSAHITSEELENPEFAEEVLGILERFDVPTGMITLEVDFANDIEHDYHLMKDTMGALADAGIKFILDGLKPELVDFASIMSLPFDVIMCDPQCVYRAQEDASYFDILGVLIDFMKDHGRKVGIKGIESDDLEDIAMSINVDYLQGNKYSSTIPFDEVVANIGLGTML
ncbi:MAG: EAL domain-containing protein [bacterium]|nr:EAL domain-containing protein [bacterium]